MEAEGLHCIEAIRARYDGHKRSPFDEDFCQCDKSHIQNLDLVLEWMQFTSEELAGLVDLIGGRGQQVNPPALWSPPGLLQVIGTRRRSKNVN
jgi:hypothetical protein